VAVNHLEGNEGDAAEVVEAAGGTAVAVPGDVSVEGDVQAMFERAGGELGGPIDLLVNNAGIEKPFPLEEMPLEEWNRVLAVNLTGAFLCSREYVRRLPGQAPPGSAIVNVSSVHELIPWRTHSQYCASKGGQKLFTETIALELAPRGIRVVAVAPGAIAVERANQNLTPEEEDQIADRRAGRPEEIAAAISWLASSEAEYVVGETLFVDGGMTRYPRFV
jgi:glucose 1-dehydrogenase